MGAKAALSAVRLGVTPLDRYLRHLESRYLSPCTIRNYRKDVGDFLRDTPDALTITRDDMRRYLLARQESGIVRNSLRRQLGTVRGFYRWLTIEGIIGRNPLAGVLALPKVHRKLPRVLSVDEITRLIEAPDAANPNGVRDRALLELLYAAGVRLSEIQSMDVADVDLKERTLRVKGKGNRERECIFGNAAAEALQTHIKGQRRRFPASKDPALFLNRFGRRISTRMLEKIVHLAGPRLWASASIPICCATPSPRTCWTAALICASSRSY